ncbi:hypothetical protein [Haloprofundus marisrubri]|uniref:hypothetical protein n=1 Tax=Haloprofundus marisrubri TaxID=1514971 RepID=UPI0012BACD4E|nr:hypothetical protein [Haloprofundus marisrubri]
MTDPALHEEGGVTVLKLYKANRIEKKVSSIRSAIPIVKEAQSGPSVCQKIITRDDTVVYNSDRNGDIEHWEAEWKLEMRAASGSDPVRRCPYQNSGCVGDDLCMECLMDKKIEEFSTSGY